MIRATTTIWSKLCLAGRQARSRRLECAESTQWRQGPDRPTAIWPDRQLCSRQGLPSQRSWISIKRWLQVEGSSRILRWRQRPEQVPSLFSLWRQRNQERLYLSQRNRKPSLPPPPPGGGWATLVNDLALQLFNQITLICDRFYNIDCSKSAQFENYSNSRLADKDAKLLDDEIIEATGAASK